ncbi:MAG TPA: hypothetical protein PLH43_11725 [Acetivibrio sp.]|uniref:hypothetical protein n=1 Tax=Acetivibrio sp. TaxID=1872092 RepID=UPI002C74B858|nr:hypothetical protein [Acetivibrio sp.]HOM03479.1 hypothetical protein [Acetivibrio sp.]
MKRKLKIGILLIVIVSIGCIVFGASFIKNNEEEKEGDVLLSLEEYEKEYGKSDVVLRFL